MTSQVPLALLPSEDSDIERTTAGVDGDDVKEHAVEAGVLVWDKAGDVGGVI